MATRIVWWVLSLGILAVFHLSVTKETFICLYTHGCYFCKYPKATKDNCLEERICLNQFRWKSVCIKRPCGIQPPVNIVGGCHGRCAIPPPVNYIVGGSQTNEGNWPWQVSLQTNSLDPFCGGVLIDKDWVLTAAQCVHESLGPIVKYFIVVLGEFDLKRRSGKEQFHPIKHIFVHPNYQPKGFMNDVALIQLEYDAYFNEYVSPICLPSFNDVYPPNSCYITGWGDTRGTGDRSRLRVAQVTVLAPDVCKNLTSGSTSGSIRPKYQICGNYSLTGACFGDAGGPLSCARSSDGRFVVAGVASAGYPPGCKRRYITIYTNIRTYVPWINNIMNSTKQRL